jgi:two-component system NtrC family sensor kinase
MNQPLGAVILLKKQSGVFTGNDQDMIAQLGNIIARSIYNSRLVKQLNVANAELEVSRSQLLHSRNTLRALFDSVPISIYIIDTEYTLNAVNMERARRTDQQPAQLVGEACYRALFQREDVCPDCQVHMTLMKGQNLNRVKRQWESDTEPLEWEINTYPIFDGADRVTQAIVFEQDVTEKRRLEANLIRSEKLAAVGQLAAGIAHEINNPLTAILANAQMLQREIPEDDDRQELVDLIARAGSRASQVVRNLLDLARKEKFEFQPTDVNETIRKSLELLQFEIAKRSVDLVFEPAADLPLVRASQDHLEGVWINLLTNAMDAMRNGHRHIQVTTRLVGSEVHVIVADSGEGIPREALPRIFEPFFTTKSPGEGTGLGLSVVHRVIKQHGGMIHVDSQAERGTQFTVALPLK